MTNRQRQLADLELNFPFPSDAAFKHQFSEREMFILLLAGINALAGIGARAIGIIREASSDGNAFVQLENVKCSQVVFSNSSDAAFYIRRGTGTAYLKIPSQAGKVVDVASTASELFVRRSTVGSAAVITYELNGETV